MIKLTIIKGVQTITEVCDKCKCHVKDLTTDDILVKKPGDFILKNSKGEVVTRTERETPTCVCENCDD